MPHIVKGAYRSAISFNVCGCHSEVGKVMVIPEGHPRVDVVQDDFIISVEIEPGSMTSQMLADRGCPEW